MYGSPVFVDLVPLRSRKVRLDEAFLEYEQLELVPRILLSLWLYYLADMRIPIHPLLQPSRGANNAVMIF